MYNESSIVSVVIVNHDGSGYLKDCLESIELQSYSLLEVIVVDNASQDGSQQMLEEGFPEVILIKNKENLFFCQANNQGIEVARGKYILCLNNDVILDRDFVKYLIEKKDFDQNIGMLGGKILRMDRETIDTTGQLFSKSRRPVERGYGCKDNGQFNREGYVFGIGGAAVLYSKRMLEEIKEDAEYFDSNFKVFYEDFDLCWRANRYGWKAYYLPHALGYHRRGATATSNTAKPKFLKRFYSTHLSPELQALVLRNRYLTIIKNDRLGNFIKDFISIISYDFIFLTYLLFFSPKTFLHLFKFKSSLKQLFIKRRTIQKKLAILNKK